MSEARALTNFAGNAVATVLVGGWTGELDKTRLRQVLSGTEPYVEVPESPSPAEPPAPAPAPAPTPVPA
jgi:aerobic C4-dicarboxylate transport protein